MSDGRDALDRLQAAVGGTVHVFSYGPELHVVPEGRDYYVTVHPDWHSEDAPDDHMWLQVWPHGEYVNDNDALLDDESHGPESMALRVQDVLGYDTFREVSLFCL